MKAVSVLALLFLAVAGCDDGGGLSAAEQEWCSLPDASEDTAVKFDIIFEAGARMGLPMDELNATAARLNDGYLGQGLSIDEAVRAVSTDLLEEPDFVAACQSAFVTCDEILLAEEDVEALCP